MNQTEISPVQTPEELEPVAKKAELSRLEGELFQKELDLATLEAELSIFNRRYLQTVGARLARLDELEAQLAEAFARTAPEEPEAAGKRIVDLGLPPDLLVILIARDDDFVIATGSTEIRAGDRLLVIAGDEAFRQVEQAL